jgi:hypothetical protein
MACAGVDYAMRIALAGQASDDVRVDALHASRPDPRPDPEALILQILITDAPDGTT